MASVRKYIYRNYDFNEEESKHVESIIQEINDELDDGEYNDMGTGMISECHLIEVFEEKLQERLNQQ